MKKLSVVAIRLGGLLASLALVLGVASSNATCVMAFHQPKVPQGMSKFAKGRSGL